MPDRAGEHWYSDNVWAIIATVIATQRNEMPDIRLTEYSHGAGCGCKISPEVLDTILASSRPILSDPRLLVGNQSRDDAAVYDLGDGRGIISTTDFFMPIVDDPFDFGRIAATNAISDIYAMGGTPMVAIAILGWPVEVLPAAVAARVIEGGRAACADAGISIAGGHSIDTPEPIFGLAVTGSVALQHLKKNDSAGCGDSLYLTKPIGIGILTTAQKKKLLAAEHVHLARDVMCQLNTLGAKLARVPGVSAMTDVTGFGLAGHLLEMCQGATLMAELEMQRVPLIQQVEHYRALGAIPGGTKRNFASYGMHLPKLDQRQRQLLCDPQTSGGLLLSVREEARSEVECMLREHGCSDQPIGRMMEKTRHWLSLA